MKNSLKPIGIIIAFLFVFFLLFLNSEDSEINWYPTFKAKDKMPFGTYVLFSELSSKSETFTLTKKQNLNAFISKHIVDFAEMDSLEKLQQPLYNVILIEEEMEDLNYYETENILDFIEEGHTVLFSSLSIPDYILEQIDKSNTLTEEFFMDSITLKSESFPELLYPKGELRQQFSNSEYAEKIYEYSTDYYEELKPSFIEYKIGKGQLLLHTFPYAFTNYYMLDSNVAYRENVNQVINRLPNKELIWVKTSKRYYQENDEKNILSVITSIPQLNLAWKLIIIGLLLYSLFKVKREQRIIPIIEPVKNKTKEFVEVVSQVHSKEQNFTVLSHKKYIYIIDFLRKTHYIDMNNTHVFVQDMLLTKTKLSKKETSLFLNYIKQNKDNRGFTEVQFLEFCKLSDKIENIN